MGTRVMDAAQSRAVDKKRQGFATLRDLLDKSKSQLQAALPRHMTAERLIRVALTAYQKTPELANCDVMSVVQATMESAQLGLEPDGTLGHAYLVPYKGKAKLIPGYKGYIALAYRSGLVSSIYAEIAYQHDEFELDLGVDAKLIHRPNLDAADRGEPRVVYAVCKMKDGSHAFSWLTKADVERLRKRSQAPNSPAWRDDWGAMAKKTAVRQLAKWIPQCPELQQAAATEEAIDIGLDLGDDAIEVEPTATTEPPKSRAEQVADKVRPAAPSEPKRESKPAPDVIDEATGEVIDEDDKSAIDELFS